MNGIFEWIAKNVYWIFDGIGVIVITGIVGIIFKKKNKEKSIIISQKGGKNSVNIQNNNIGSEK